MTYFNHYFFTHTTNHKKKKIYNILIHITLKHLFKRLQLWTNFCLFANDFVMVFLNNENVYCNNCCILIFYSISASMFFIFFSFFSLTITYFSILGILSLRCVFHSLPCNCFFKHFKRLSLSVY